MWERHIDWLTLVWALTRDQTCNPGMCPDWESNLRPFLERKSVEWCSNQLSHTDQGYSFSLSSFFSPPPPPPSPPLLLLLLLFSFFLKISFIFREWRRAGEREEGKHQMWGNTDQLFLKRLNLGPASQPRCVSWPGFKLGTFRPAEQCPTH